MAIILGRLGHVATAKLLATTGVDDFGDLVYGETDVVFDCHLRTLSSKELPDGITAARWKLYASPDEDLSASDRVSIGGEVFEFVTRPTVRINPRTGLGEALEAEIERAK